MNELLPSVLLITFLIRLLIYGVTFPDSIALAALCGFVAYGWDFYGNRKPVNKEVFDKLTELEDQVKQTKDKVNSISFGSHLKR